eukprot:SAG11_NODE_1337_length_5172_cov_2.438399_4_plen_151_part_00
MSNQRNGFVEGKAAERLPGGGVEQLCDKTALLFSLSIAVRPDSFIINHSQRGESSVATVHVGVRTSARTTPRTLDRMLSTNTSSSGVGASALVTLGLAGGLGGTATALVVSTPSRALLSKLNQPSFRNVSLPTADIKKHGRLLSLANTTM